MFLMAVIRASPNSTAYGLFSSLLRLSSPSMRLCRPPRALHRRLSTSKSTPALSTPPHLIRNATIIAHIDHGKSSLTSQLLRATDEEKEREDISMLDTLSVERDRGITVKATAASLTHKKDGERYLVNLFDSPGHVDFTSEVSGSIDKLRKCVRNDGKPLQMTE